MVTSTVDSFDPAPPAIRRDRWSRPLVVPPVGGKTVPYTRCTTYVDCLEDQYHLTRWKMRMVALGLADRQDLLLSVAAHRDDKSHLNDLCEKAMEAAKGTAPATTGTALHALCEQMDRGRLLGTVPAPYAADLDAYRAATAWLRPVEIESFSVHDGLKIGGTPDRIAVAGDRHVVADIKTGASAVDFGQLKIAMQLAVYAHSVPYDPRTHTRIPRPYAVDQDEALVIHLPAGEGRCDLYWVDIAEGWEAVQIATQVRDYRSRKNWLSRCFPHVPAVELTAALATAGTLDELRGLWMKAVSRGEWTDEHLAIALARKEELEHVA